MIITRKVTPAKGLLFLGHAEIGIFRDGWHSSKKYPKAFIVRKFNDSPEIATEKKTNISSRNKTTIKPLKDILKPKFKFNTDHTKPKNITNNKVKKSLDKSNILSLTSAQILFNSKKYMDAENTCLTLLEKNKQESEIHLLLGQINIEINNPDKAAKYFHNVIYLSPGNYDALMHLYRLELSKGNETQAERLLSRAKRSQEKVNK